MSLISKKTDKGYLDNYNRCTWVRLYYGVISKIIKENNFKKCAEIGIGYGFHAKEILMNSDVEMLYLVDPYVFYPNDGFATDVEKFGGFEKLEKNVKINLEEYSNRYKWFKQPSLSITNEADDQWMVAVAPNAGKECILDTANATFRKCGTNIISSIVPMYINVPEPYAIRFNISQTVLTPTNDPAHFQSLSQEGPNTGDPSE